MYLLESAVFVFHDWVIPIFLGRVFKNVRINLFYLFFTVVPSNTCVFHSCRPFIVNTFSTDLVGVEVSSRWMLEFKSLIRPTGIVIVGFQVWFELQDKQPRPSNNNYYNQWSKLKLSTAQGREVTSTPTRTVENVVLTTKGLQERNTRVGLDDGEK